MRGGQNHDFLLENTDLRNELGRCLREIVGWEKRELPPHRDYKRECGHPTPKKNGTECSRGSEWGCNLSQAPGFVSEFLNFGAEFLIYEA